MIKFNSTTLVRHGNVVTTSVWLALLRITQLVTAVYNRGRAPCMEGVTYNHHSYKNAEQQSCQRLRKASYVNPTVPRSSGQTVGYNCQVAALAKLKLFQHDDAL